ncbi:hypothetical protein ACFL6E_06645 [Candidatus Neomarinimicrobiota bacterium]
MHQDFAIFGLILNSVFYVAIIVMNIPLKRWTQQKAGNWIAPGGVFLAYFLVIFISYMRGTGYGNYSPIRSIMISFNFLVFLTFCGLYFSRLAKTGKPSMLWHDLFIGVVLVLLINYIGKYVFQIPAFEELNFTVKGFNVFGLVQYRQYFPITTSTRELAQLAGMACIMLAFFIKGRERQSSKSLSLFLAIFLWPLLVVTIIIIDAKLILLLTILLTLAYLFAGKKKYPIKFTPIAISLMLVYPALHLGLLAAYPALLDQSDLWTVTGRIIIWPAAFLEWLNMSSFQKFFGVGYRSHLALELSRYFEFNFTTWMNSENISAHNASLQTILDSGLVGLAAFAALVFSIYGNISKLISKAIDRRILSSHNLAVFILLFVVGLGMTEIVCSYYAAPAMRIMVILHIYSITPWPGTALPNGNRGNRSKRHSPPAVSGL